MTKVKENIPIGLKLAQLRKKRNVTLDELSDKTGLKISHLERIEEGKDFAPVGDILKISRALTINPDELLNLQAEKKKDDVKKKEQKREDLYQYTLLTPDVKDKRLRAFRVAIPAHTEHPKVKYQHDGEELIYVLKGEVEVRVGQKKRLLKKDEALLFDSGIKHTLKNKTNKETVLMVTVFTP
jgi:quercetin dioxygenase-like cupin family protein